MNLTLIFTLINFLNSQDQVCPDPFEVGFSTLTAHYKGVQFSCNNVEKYTHCQYREYELPKESAKPGGCKLRKEPPIMDAVVRNYDCKSRTEHWNFGNEMITKYNLTCSFEVEDE